MRFRASPQSSKRVSEICFPGIVTLMNADWDALSSAPERNAFGESRVWISGIGVLGAGGKGPRIPAEPSGASRAGARFGCSRGIRPLRWRFGWNRAPLRGRAPDPAFRSAAQLPARVWLAPSGSARCTLLSAGRFNLRGGRAFGLPAVCFQKEARIGHTQTAGRSACCGRCASESCTAGTRFRVLGNETRLGNREVGFRELACSARAGRQSRLPNFWRSETAHQAFNSRSFTDGNGPRPSRF